MATTTNFGWETPDDTDLVKDGAAAMRTLGNAIDTSLVDLKGGTTGQILSKASNTDMDFTWIANDQGDITGVTAGTGLTGGGTSGAVSLAFDEANYGGGQYAAGKNKILNGDFTIAQRGTSFTASNNNDDAYVLDRWYILSDGNDVIDVTQSTEAPINGLYSIALDVETINKKFGIAQIIEQKDLTNLIGNTCTFSFKAKVSSITKLDNVKCAIVAWSGTADTVTSDIISAWNVEGTNPTLIANATYENTPANLNVTTSWATYSVSAAIDTASTKNVIVFIWSDVTDTTLGDFLYITDAQLEKGSIGTPFSRAGGTIQGELAAAQRYYWRNKAENNESVFAVGCANASTNAIAAVPFPVTMRVVPSFSYASIQLYEPGYAGALTALTNRSTLTTGSGDFATAGPMTAGRAVIIRASATTAAYMEWSAEL